MPHLIDKAVMQDLQSWYPKDFERTSSHRFRSGDDMQFAFSYFYFLMSEPTGISRKAFLEETIDVNADGVLNCGELRALANRINSPVDWKELNVLFWEAVHPETVETDKEAGMSILKAFALGPDDMAKAVDVEPPTSSSMATLEKVRPKASPSAQGEGSGAARSRNDALEHVQKKGGIPISWLLDSKAVCNKIEKALEHTPKYKHEMGDTSAYVAFHMVGDDEAGVRKQLDSIWSGRPYFICVNDNMNKTQPNPAVIDALHEFYTTLLPTPSQFELPENETNSALHIDEWVAPAQTNSSFKWPALKMKNVGMVIAVCLILWILLRLRSHLCRKRKRSLLGY